MNEPSDKDGFFPCSGNQVEKYVSIPFDLKTDNIVLRLSLKFNNTVVHSCSDVKQPKKWVSLCKGEKRYENTETCSKIYSGFKIDSVSNFNPKTGAIFAIILVIVVGLIIACRSFSNKEKPITENSGKTEKPKMSVNTPTSSEEPNLSKSAKKKMKAKQAKEEGTNKNEELEEPEESEELKNEPPIDPIKKEPEIEDNPTSKKKGHKHSKKSKTHSPEKETTIQAESQEKPVSRQQEEPIVEKSVSKPSKTQSIPEKTKEQPKPTTDQSENQNQGNII